jgi:hypothetical protein
MGMRWFSLRAEGASLPWKEWEKVVGDPEDLLACVALGARAHRSCLRAAGLPYVRAEDALTAMAHVLHHFMDEMDEERWLELRWHLQEGWREHEPALWESPEQFLVACDGLLPALLGLQHDLERVVRPELHRLLWCMLTSSGKATALRSLERRDPRGGLLFPIMLLEQLSADRVPPFLDRQEREGVSALRSALRLSPKVPTDELWELLAARRYLLMGGKVHLETYTRPAGEPFGRTDVLRWRDRSRYLCALLIAFRVMFLASVIGESGPLRVNVPD